LNESTARERETIGGESKIDNNSRIRVPVEEKRKPSPSKL